jgi:hypothetical protein
MGGSSKMKQDEGQSNEANLMQSFHIADLISLEALVNLLVRKGICTPDELFEEERKRQQHYQKIKDVSLVQTKDLDSRGDGEAQGRQSSWLKRKMSKRRWTRKLGTALFGWRWRKVKHDPKTRKLEKV